MGLRILQRNGASMSAGNALGAASGQESDARKTPASPASAGNEKRSSPASQNAREIWPFFCLHGHSCCLNRGARRDLFAGRLDCLSRGLAEWFKLTNPA